MMNTFFKLLISTSIVFSSVINSTELRNKVEQIDTTEGYPYNLLVNRVDKVKLIYKGTNQITCRVEVHNKGQIWSGELFSTNSKKFSQKPLTECMDRELTKKIVSSTF